MKSDGKTHSHLVEWQRALSGYTIPFSVDLASPSDVSSSSSSSFFTHHRHQHKEWWLSKCDKLLNEIFQFYCWTSPQTILANVLRVLHHSISAHTVCCVGLLVENWFNIFFYYSFFLLVGRKNFFPAWQFMAICFSISPACVCVCVLAAAVLLFYRLTGVKQTITFRGRFIIDYLPGFLPACCEVMRGYDVGSIEWADDASSPFPFFAFRTFPLPISRPSELRKTRTREWGRERDEEQERKKPAPQIGRSHGIHLW